MSLKLWLHEYVLWGETYVKRGKILKGFLDEGLIPFINSMGYAIGTPPNVMFGEIASGLYENRQCSTFDSKWNMKYYCRNWTPEDRMHFYHVVDPDAWNGFWNQWKNMEDVSSFSFRGRDRQMDIEEYIWRQLDLDNSYQSEVLYGGDDEDYEPEIDDNFKKVDVYLLETSGWGGLRR